MSNKELVEDINHLRIKYGTTNLYRTLLKLLRDEFEELSSLFSVSPGNPTSAFYSTNPADYYSNFMEVAAQAAHDTLQEQHPAPLSGFYDEETLSLDAQSIHGDEFSLAPEEDADCMDLITQLYNDISKRVEAESTDEAAGTPQEPPPLKIIQTGGASAASEESHTKRPLKKKAAAETVAVIKEADTTAPPKKKISKKTQ
jgi:hypothetical protein